MRRFTKIFPLFAVVVAGGWLCYNLARGEPVYGQAPVADAVLARPNRLYLPLVQGGPAVAGQAEGMADELVADEVAVEVADEVAVDEVAVDELVYSAALTEIVPDSPECLSTAVPIVPLAEPSWRFVLNFNVWLPKNQLAGCVLLHRTNELNAFTALRVRCKRNGAVTPVTVAPALNPSQAQFTGGYITCPVNLMTAINDLQALDSGGALIHLASAYSYPAFTVISRGQLQPGVGSTLMANPLVAYQPRGLKKPDFAFFAPLKPNFSTRAVLVSYYRSQVANKNKYFTNGNFASCSFDLFTPPLPQSWSVTRQPSENLIRHWLKGQDPFCSFALQPPLQFATDGGTFFIGYTTLQPSQRLQGTLDEVIVDPPGSTKPPS